MNRLLRYAFLISFALANTACQGLALVVEDPRALPASAGSGTAVYFGLRNHTTANDRLIGASSDVAGSIEIHRSALLESEEAEQIEEDGGEYHYELAEEEEEKDSSQELQMNMAVLDTIKISGGYELEFEPGYFHLMLLGLNRDLKAGEHFTLVLHFERTGDVTIDVIVMETEE